MILEVAGVTQVKGRVIQVEERPPVNEIDDRAWEETMAEVQMLTGLRFKFKEPELIM